MVTAACGSRRSFTRKRFYKVIEWLAVRDRTTLSTRYNPPMIYQLLKKLERRPKKIEKPKKQYSFGIVVESKKVTRNRTHLDRKDSVGNKRIFIEVF